MVSTRFTQCQTVIRNNLRKSSNNDVVRIYHNTNCDTNLQYDQIKFTKEVITRYRKNKEDRITTVLTTQSLVIKSIWEHGMKSAAEIVPDQFQSCRKKFTTFLFATSITPCKCIQHAQMGQNNITLCLHCNKNSWSCGC